MNDIFLFKTHLFHCEPCAAYFVTYLVFIAVLYVYSQPVCNSTIMLPTAVWNTGTRIHCSAGRMRNVNWGFLILLK